MLLRKKHRFTAKANRPRTFEQLELRQLMAIDVADARLAKNWVPVASEIHLDNVALPASFAPSTLDWQQVLTPQSNQLFRGDSHGASFRVTAARHDEAIGATHVYLQQTLNGLDVVNAYANLTVLDSGRVFKSASSFVPAIKSKGTLSNLAGVSPEQALANVAKDYGWTGVNVSQISRAAGAAFGKQTATLHAPAVARVDVPFESVYIPKADGTLDLGWRLNVQASQGDAWLDAAVSSVDGQVLYVADWNSHAQYQAFALPKESPSDGGRTAVVDPQSPIYSPFGWHDTNGVTGAESQLTIGNNTQAYRDTDANNLPDAGSSPSGGAGLVFNPSLDLAQSPAINADASTVNLFYVTNVLHDVFAAKGFTAAAGNFQTNNYGGGGIGGDPLLAEDRDGSGTDNANMATPPDGTSPRMQMFDWTITTPARSGSFDNGVVVHEFGHGVTNRLTGGPANSSALSNLQSGGMGEGWSDYFALAFTQVAADTALQGRGIGTYVLGEPSTGAGIRSQRYSYDMSINTLTFDALNSLNQVHDIGEIWASVLWDLNWALINGSTLDASLPNAGLGFNSNLTATTGGNNMALKLVVEALKLQPANPTFLQARDAILSADQLLNAGLYQSTIWKVFARRGMGLSAQAGDSDSNQVVAAFDTPIFNSLVYVREGLFGSNISRVKGQTLPIVTGGGNQTLTFTAEAASKVSFTVQPGNMDATLTVSVLNAANSVVLGPFIEGAGAPVTIEPWTVPVSGGYKLVVTSNSPTALYLESARNAALESQVGDSSYLSEMNISPSQRVYNTGNTNEVVGTSSAGLKATSGNAASKFVDISTTGTPIVLTDDGEAQVTTTVGNSLFPAGPVTISSNGAILASPLRDLTYLNTPIDAIATDAPPGLYPFWDDLYTGTVHWQEIVINGINTLVVQWTDRPHYPGVGAVTFQVQVPATGAVLARFAYKDVLFEDPIYNSGGSATVGVVADEGRLQYSFNTASLLNNDYIEFSRQEDIDEFTFTGVAGQRVGVAFDALKTSAADLRGTFVRLLNSSNTVLAQASTKPLSITSTVANYDLGFVNFVLPTTGTFSVRVYGRASFDYYLAITKNLALDTENSSGASTPRYLVSLPGAVLGHLTTSDVRDLYAFQLNAGQTVRLTLTRPDDDVGVSPVNNLQPRLVVTRPNGSAATSSSIFDPSGQMIVNYTAVESGQHLIDVRRITGFGVYAVRAQLVTAALRGEGETLPTGASESVSMAGGLTASQPATGLVAPAIERPVGSAISSWHNAAQAMDVNGDARVTPLDALLLINEINARRISVASSQLPPRITARQIDQFFDTNGDGVVSPLDVLLMLDYLKRRQ